MKAGELRIGNWYQSVKWVVPVRCELPDLYNLSAMADGADDDPPIDEMFEPILIDEEWLLKFGFSIDHLSPNIFYLPFQASYLTVALGKYSHIGIVKEKQDAVLYLRFPDIEYIHQLQNLYYALTGEELTIK